MSRAYDEEQNRKNNKERVYHPVRVTAAEGMGRRRALDLAWPKTAVMVHIYISPVHIPAQPPKKTHFLSRSPPSSRG
jgi:hypothetical protein